MVLRATLYDSAEVAPFSGVSIWDVVQQIGEIPASGGTVYDAFIIEILAAAGAEAIATRDTDDFRRLSGSLRIVDPLS